MKNGYLLRIQRGMGVDVFLEELTPRLRSIGGRQSAHDGAPVQRGVGLDVGGCIMKFGRVQS